MAFSQWDQERLERLIAHKKALEEQIARHEIRSERVLVLFTKANIDRLQKMSESLNTSRNDLLNKLIEHAYLTGLYKDKLTIDEGSNPPLSPRRGVSFKKGTKTQPSLSEDGASLWTKTEKQSLAKANKRGDKTKATKKAPATAASVKAKKASS